MKKPKLFSEYKIKSLQLKNRIVMSPMCMYSSNDKDGKVTDWHILHYSTRAVGQVGLIIQEATAVAPQGRISDRDLGIWDDGHIESLKKLTTSVHNNGSKIGIQLAHAGRKAEVDGEILAPSVIPFSENYSNPQKMSIEDIKNTVNNFRESAVRAREAGYDVIEIHAAHGYLINEFLSPLTNKREDRYGGSLENRYRFLSEVIESVKEVWQGPLFVRISATDHHPEGIQLDDYIKLAETMKEQGVDLIDCSSGGLVQTSIDVYPGYQVRYSEEIRKTGIATGTVGLITTGRHAEAILKNERADLVFLGRELLRNPYWPEQAAVELNYQIESPVQYERGWR